MDSLADLVPESPTLPPLKYDVVPQLNPAVVPRPNPAVVPRLNPAVVPRLNPAVVPRLNPAVVPRLNPAVVPHLNPAVVPRPNPAVVPRLNPAVVPRLNPAVVPHLDPAVVLRLDPAVVPRLDPAVVPRLNPAVVPRLDPAVVPRLDPAVVPRLNPAVVLRLDPTVVPYLDHGGYHSVPKFWFCIVGRYREVLALAFVLALWCRQRKQIMFDTLRMNTRTFWVWYDVQITFSCYFRASRKVEIFVWLGTEHFSGSFFLFNLFIYEWQMTCTELVRDRLESHGTLTGSCNFLQNEKHCTKPLIRSFFFEWEKKLDSIYVPNKTRLMDKNIWDI